MIDTLKLNIPFSSLTQHGIDFEKSPLMRWLWGQSFITLTSKGNGLYSPRLWLHNYYGRRNLNISFSAQKMVYGNNLYEIWEQDGEEVFKKLQDTLLQNAHILSSEILEHASLQEIHFGKNIIFQDHTQPRSLIDIISRTKINWWLEYTTKDYVKGGICLRMSCDEYEISIYDKMYELMHSRNKYDKKHGKIFEKYIREKRKKWPFEVLRIEIRLKSPKKIEAIWKKYSKLELNCKNALCHHAPWQQYLSDVWSLIFKASYGSVQSDLTPLELICALKDKGICHSQDILALLWYHMLQKENPQLLHGTYYLPENAKRKMLDKARYKEAMVQICPRKHTLEQISQQINANERFRPSNSEEDMSIIFK